jgi:hypothetical protein
MLDFRGCDRGDDSLRPDPSARARLYFKASFRALAGRQTLALEVVE